LKSVADGKPKRTTAGPASVSTLKSIMIEYFLRAISQVKQELTTED
jgi:hypothetical protein